MINTKIKIFFNILYLAISMFVSSSANSESFIEKSVPLCITLNQNLGPIGDSMVCMDVKIQVSSAGAISLDPGLKLRSFRYIALPPEVGAGLIPVAWKITSAVISPKVAGFLAEPKPNDPRRHLQKLDVAVSATLDGNVNSNSESTQYKVVFGPTQKRTAVGETNWVTLSNNEFPQISQLTSDQIVIGSINSLNWNNSDHELIFPESYPEIWTWNGSCTHFTALGPKVPVRGRELLPGDRIVTGPDSVSSCWINFGGGDLSVGPDSYVEITETGASAPEKMGVFWLLKGKISSTVDRERWKLEWRYPHGIVGDQGTIFSIAYNDVSQRMCLQVAEGNVDLKSKRWPELAPTIIEQENKICVTGDEQPPRPRPIISEAVKTIHIDNSHLVANASVLNGGTLWVVAPEIPGRGSWNLHSPIDENLISLKSNSVALASRNFQFELKRAVEGDCEMLFEFRTSPNASPSMIAKISLRVLPEDVWN